MIYLINAESTITEINPGMITVDIAWDIFLQKNHLAIPYKRFSIKAKEQTIHITDTMHLRYNSSLDFNLSMLDNDDILVFWGDFLHAHHYLKNDLLRIARKRKLKNYLFDLFKHPKLQRFNDNNYLDWAYEFYLLQGAEQKHWKGSISFGTTLIGDHDFGIMKQTNYINSFTKFIQNLDHIWTRDVYSALQASHIREDYEKSHLGIDAALLIAPEDYDAILDAPTVILPKEKYILTHFARTKAPINQLLSLAQRISLELEMPLFWLPWLNHLDEKLKDSFDEIDAGNYSDLIHTLRNASLIVTDTYHLALIGWRLGVPVLCIGSGIQYPSSTIDDKKKEVFYLFYKDTIKYNESITSEKIQKVNENLNRLSLELKKKGIKLYFMPAVDKLNLYSKYIIDNKYGQSTFFEQLRPMKKEYELIDTKAILEKEIDRGITDVFYSDDTHWSYKASDAIAKSFSRFKDWSK